MLGREIRVRTGEPALAERLPDVAVRAVDDLPPGEPLEISLVREEDLYQVDGSRTGLGVLPGDLGQAIDELKKDRVIQDALGQHIFERYVEAKLQEWNEYRVHVTQWELDRYLHVY